MTLLLNAFTASAFMRGSTATTTGLRHLNVAVCGAKQVVALKQDLISPQEFMADETGMPNAYVDLYDPTSPRASYVTESRAGFYVVSELTTEAAGVCHKTGFWTFAGDGMDDIIYTQSMCDGSLIDGTYEHEILYGTGKYECATGNVVRTEFIDGDIVTFDISICIDQSACA